MLNYLFGIDSSEKVTDIVLQFGQGWGLAVLLLLAGVALTVYLYRKLDPNDHRRCPPAGRVDDCPHPAAARI
jgi:hypothetical protein